MEEELSLDNILGADGLTISGGRNLKCTSLWQIHSQYDGHQSSYTGGEGR